MRNTYKTPAPAFNSADKQRLSLRGGRPLPHPPGQFQKELAPGCLGRMRPAQPTLLLGKRQTKSSAAVMHKKAGRKRPANKKNESPDVQGFRKAINAWSTGTVRGQRAGRTFYVLSCGHPV